MSKKTMITTMLVAAMLMLGGVASAQDSQTKKEPVVDLTLVPEVRKEALGLTAVQLRQMAKARKTYNDAVAVLRADVERLARSKGELVREGKLTPDKNKAINTRINRLHAQIHRERDAARVAMYRTLNPNQKQRMQHLCAAEVYLRPGVKLTCKLPVHELGPMGNEPEPKPEEPMTERELQAKAEAEEAKNHPNNNPGAREMTPEQAEEARVRAMEAEEAKAKHQAASDPEVKDPNPEPNPEMTPEQAEEARLRALVEAAERRAGHMV